MVSWNYLLYFQVF